MDGTTSLPLSVSSTHTPRPLPVSSFFLFLFFCFPTNTIFHFLPTSVPASCGPSALFFYGFSSVSLPRRPPTFWSWMEVSELRSGPRKDLFSTAPASPPTYLNPLLSLTCSFLSLLFPTSQLSFLYRSRHTLTATVHIYFGVHWLLTFLLYNLFSFFSLFALFPLCVIALCLFSLSFVLQSLLLGLCVCVCGQLFLVLHSWCQIG